MKCLWLIHIPVTFLYKLLLKDTDCHMLGKEAWKFIKYILKPVKQLKQATWKKRFNKLTLRL